MSSSNNKFRVETHDESVGAVKDLCRELKRRGLIVSYESGDYDGYVDVVFKQ